ncbi:MAG TPA: maleylpyruvate isomerase family mycothiol-dependent enzyme [Acidimicrobiales bacterium]|nr:maleylpyruvate isomerase family mycothiol-dependent enzyme [Acidimicrobiales bacterium]
MTLPTEQMLATARHERDALGRTIQYTPPEAWEAESRLPGWRNRDIVAHLAGAEVVAAGVLAADNPAELEEYFKTEEGRQPTLDRFNDFSVKRRLDAPFRQVALEWGSAADLFLARAGRVSAEDWTGRRVPWLTGDIPVRYLVQARVAEWWMHGEDIRAGAGLEPRIEHWPIFALNDLAIRALPWALGLAGLTYHGKTVRITLEGAGGGDWHYGLAPREVPPPGRSPDATIGGRGHPFALVAARRVPADDYIRDGTLVVGGDQSLALTVLRNLRVFG